MLVYMYILYTYIHIFKNKIKYFKRKNCNTEIEKKKSSFFQQIFFMFVIILPCFSLLKTDWNKETKPAKAEFQDLLFFMRPPRSFLSDVLLCGTHLLLLNLWEWSGSTFPHWAQAVTALTKEVYLLVYLRTYYVLSLARDICCGLVKKMKAVILFTMFIFSWQKRPAIWILLARSL